MKVYSITMVEYRAFIVRAKNSTEAKELAMEECWSNGEWIDSDITDCDELMSDKDREERNESK